MMNIVFCFWKSICEPGMTNAFERLGHKVLVFEYPLEDKDLDAAYMKALSDFLMEHPQAEMVFSINFIPIVAKTCGAFRLPYVTYTVDSPCLTLDSKALDGPHCKTVLFDHALFEQYKDRNPGNVFYLPLGASMDIYDEIKLESKDEEKYACDVSFIGTFHTEYCRYDSVSPRLPEKMRGFADGLIDAQLHVYGYYLLKDAISEEWAREFKKHAGWERLPDYTEEVRDIVADDYLAPKCTQKERIATIDALSRRFDLDLYTTEDTSMFKKVKNKGIASSFSMMPKIFKCSKINLNMTSRGIKTGLPLRIFDIMAAGGLVMTNYQSEIPEYFVPGEDIVMYESIPDLLEKTEYYLSHEDERRQIAANGHKKVRENHTLEHRAAAIMKMCGFA